MSITHVRMDSGDRFLNTITSIQNAIVNILFSRHYVLHNDVHKEIMTADMTCSNNSPTIILSHMNDFHVLLF